MLFFCTVLLNSRKSQKLGGKNLCRNFYARIFLCRNECRKGKMYE